MKNQSVGQSQVITQSIFVSHASEELKHAQMFQLNIQLLNLPIRNVFVSSDISSIRTGAVWFDSLSKALRETKVLVALLSPESVDNAWISFESGFALGIGAELVLCPIRNLQPGQFPLPFVDLPVRVVDEQSGFAGLAQQLEEILPFPKYPIAPKAPARVKDVKSRQVEQPQSGTDGVFVSHAAEDLKHALVLQRYIPKLFGSRRRVFSSSEISTARSGATWFERLSRALRYTGAIVVLLSPESANNPCIAFETGFALALGSEILPYSIKGLQPQRLRSPFAQLQVRAVDEGIGFEDFVRQLKRALSHRGYLIVPEAAVHELRGLR